MSNSDKEDGVIFSKGINLKDLMSENGSEFKLDINFKGKKDKYDTLIMDENDLEDDFIDDSSSDSEEVLKDMAQSAELQVLSSPEYVSFDDLSRKMIDCVPSGDVKILIVKEGDQLVPEDAEVTIHYAAYWEKEDIAFDTTLTRNFGAPAKFRLGTGSLIPGLEIGLTTVKGPRAHFHLLVKAPWGALAAPPRIRPERALFTVSLRSVSDRAAIDRFNILPKEEQKKFAVSMNTAIGSNAAAKELFKKRSYHEAAKHYHKSLYVLQLAQPENDAEKTEIKNLMCTIYVNLAICYYKLNLPHKILLMCDELGKLSNISTNCKALYYYGKAFLLQGDYKEAEKYFKRALKLEPKNADIGKALSELNDMIENAAKKEKTMWRTAFKNQNNDAQIKTDNIDEDFKSNLRETCADLAGRTEFAKFDLPSGLMRKEVEYIRKLTKEFEGLSVFEEGEGRKYKVSIVKQCTA